MKQFYLLLFSLVITSLAGCSKKYQSTDARQLAAEHRVIAILPPNVTLTGKQTGQSDEREGTKVQQTLYSWIFASKTQSKLPINILTIRETNNLLDNAGYFENANLSFNDICQLLEVDGVISTDYTFKKKASGAEAAASSLLLGIKPASGKVNMLFQLFDARSGKVIWGYQDKLHDFDRSSSISIADKMSQSVPHSDALNTIVKRASNKLPYSRQSSPVSLFNDTGLQ